MKKEQKFHIRYKQRGEHVHVDVFANGALNGHLAFREDEFDSFLHALENGDFHLKETNLDQFEGDEHSTPTPPPVQSQPVEESEEEEEEGDDGGEDED